MGWFQSWHLLVLLLVVIVLFGAKRLPDAARSVGKSMKIFKAETKGLREDHEHNETTPAQDVEARRLTSGTPAAPASAGATAASDQQIADLQRQLDELKKQQNTPEQSPKNAS